MTYLRLKYRIQIVMLVLSLMLTAILVHTKRHFGVDIDPTVIGLSVCGTFLVSIVVGIFWHRATLAEENE